jgi:predicted transcriptional regulator
VLLLQVNLRPCKWISFTYNSSNRAFLQGDEIPEGLCDKEIVLILKVSKPESLTNYRVIYLCNVLYKIASKVVANRLKKVLPYSIAEEQSAFITSRLITCNVLIAYECMHTIKRQQAKNPFLLKKLT